MQATERYLSYAHAEECFVLSCVEGEGWLLFATCVLPYVPHGNMGLCKHGDPVFLHFCPLNQNLACVRTRGVGGYFVSKKSHW